MLGDRTKNTGTTHSRVSAVRAHGTTRPECSVGRPDRCAHAWNGRGGETKTAGAATHQVKVCDPRNPRYSVARRLAAGEFIKASPDKRKKFAERSECYYSCSDISLHLFENAFFAASRALPTSSARGVTLPNFAWGVQGSSHRVDHEAHARFSQTVTLRFASRILAGLAWWNPNAFRSGSSDRSIPP
jgi:hypothetical protein